MSLNKRSLKKDPKPEPSLEDALRGHERALKSRRGKNRKTAFDALFSEDPDRAIAAVQTLAPAASGKNLAELGALLASTQRPALVDAAMKGKYGDVALHEVVRTVGINKAIADYTERMESLSVGEVVRRARALGLVPLVDNARSPEAERALALLIDDARLPIEVRREAALSALSVAPSAVWSRRFGDAVDAALALAAGLATRYIAPEAFDIDAFRAALSSLSPSERTARLQAARLPASANKFPDPKKIALLCAVLDDAGMDRASKDAAAAELARMTSDHAREALLARPTVHPASTVIACSGLAPAEAHAIMAPLLASSQAARDAAVASRSVALCDAIFVDDGVALLLVDPLAAAALLARNKAPRASL
ncbi:MAG TPA: hypothetical protein VGO62_03840, partial [Myxococcota bacterium]